MDGVLVIDKPEGPTSHDIVAWCRRRLGLREIGHTGTLDPMATGVLALVIGRATRLSQFLSGQPKGYDAVVRLGVGTDTWDRTGRPEGPPFGGPWPPPERIREALAGLAGRRPQVPPPYSAKKVGGVPAHRLARRGEAVRVEPAMVELSTCEVVGVEPPLLALRLRCSAGFYVRSLAHELGRALGCGGCLEALRRTASGTFTLADSVTMAEVDADPGAARARLVPLERLLPEMPAIRLDQEQARRAAHGNDVAPAGFATTDDGRRPGDAGVRLLGPDGRLLAIARPATERPGVLHPCVVLK